MTNFSKYENLIKEKLSEYRYIHSLGVAKLSKELAIAHHLDEDKAYLSGLLHDVTKEMEEEWHDEIFRKYEDLDKIAEARPIKHSHSAMYYIKDELNISDSDILEACYNHTICNSNNPYAKILFIADKREENRKINDDVVKTALKDLDEGYNLLIKINEEYLKSKGIK